jgi:error-prone DNA polymerase
MVGQAQALGLDAIAIADRDGLYGVARAHVEAKKSGQKLIVAAELTLEPGDDVREGPERLVLLVKSHDGYARLCRMLTRAHATHEKGEAAIGVSTVAEIASATLPGVADTGLVAVAALGAREPDMARLGVLRDAFGDDLVVASFRHLDGLDGRRNDVATRAASGLGVPIVATARPLFHARSRRQLADVVHCIRHKTTLDRAGASLGSNAEARLRGEESMLALFRDEPQWVHRTAEIAARCTFSMAELRYAFPSAELCRPGETADQTLRRYVEERCALRYPGGVPAKIAAQIEKELTIIATIDVAAFFLSVHQIVEIAREKKILCQGRGSAANSAVCWVLGITAVDPERSSLLFERFLSVERAEPPDIDVDFEHERREEVIQEIYARYGRDRAAMVSEVIAYRGRSALREVGKVFGLGIDQVDRLSSIVMRYDLGDLSAERVAELGLDPQGDRVREVVTLAKQLEGAPRHLSIHVGGFVLSAEPLDGIAPIEPARMENRTVIPWDKDDLDALGFFKVDVLALGMLTAIRKSLALVHEHDVAAGRTTSPFDPIEALAAIPPEDPVVYEAISNADTVGVFQIESRAQMSMLPRLRPKEFYDLVVEVAIVRPGPIQGGMVHPYLRRRQGQEPPVPPHPCLAEILERTLGVPLFQEQVMQIAMTGASYTPGEADQLRRDMAAWKKHGRMERHYERLLRGFADKGISREFGEAIYQQILGFGEYGFPESHAASFALLVYASSWLKVHHAAVFACALLDSQPMGFYSPSSIVRDAKDHGVLVRPVRVESSGWDHSLEPDEASTGGWALRLGLRIVKGLGEPAARAIEAARAERPFESVHDVVYRASLAKDDIESLAECGALESLATGRRRALWEAHAPTLDGLFDGRSIEHDTRSVAAALTPMRSIEQLVLDYEHTGLSLEDHPMRHVRPRIAELTGVPSAKMKVVTAGSLASTRDRSAVAVAGLVIGRQRPMTASGITFMTLEDETGIANLVVRLDTWEKYRGIALHSKMILVRGRVEREGQVVHVLVREMFRLQLPNGTALPVRSRDFH